MSNFRRQILMVAFKLSDMLIMIGSFMAATIMVSYGIDTISLDQFLHMRIKVENFALFLGLLLMWHAIFAMFDLYSSRRLSTVKTEIKDIFYATSLGTLAIYILSLLFDMIMVTPVFLISFWAGSTVITILTRIIMRLTLNWIRRRGRNLRYLLIVGTNSRAVQFARKIESRPELGYVLSGFVDVDRISCMSIGYLDYIYILWHYVTKICSIHPLKSLKILKDFATNSSTTVKVQFGVLVDSLNHFTYLRTKTKKLYHFKFHFLNFELTYFQP